MKAYLGLRDTDACSPTRRRARAGASGFRPTSTTTRGCAWADHHRRSEPSPGAFRHERNRHARPHRPGPRGRGARRAHRRDHQRLRRRRAALRPVLRRDRRAQPATASGRSRSSPPRSSRRRAASPGAAATASASARGGSPTAATRPTSSSRSTSRCCSAASQAGELKPGCAILLENMWREHRDPAVVASYTETRGVAARRRASASTRCRWSASAASSSPTRAGQEHVRARHAVQRLQLRSDAGARAGRADLRQEGREGRAGRTRRLLDAGYAWAEQPRLPLPHPGRDARPSRRS